MNSNYYHNRNYAYQRAAEIREEAAQRELARQPRLARRAGRRERWHEGWLTFAIVIALTVLALALLFGAPITAEAQEMCDAGDGDMLHDVMLAFSLGNYYFHAGSYERALGYLLEAADLLPVEVLTVEPGYAEIYLVLGFTQQQLGMMTEAEANFTLFRQYLPEESYRVEAGIAAELAG